MGHTLLFPWIHKQATLCRAATGSRCLRSCRGYRRPAQTPPYRNWAGAKRYLHYRAKACWAEACRWNGGTAAYITPACAWCLSLLISCLMEDGDGYVNRDGLCGWWRSGSSLPFLWESERNSTSCLLCDHSSDLRWMIGENRRKVTITFIFYAYI